MLDLFIVTCNNKALKIITAGNAMKDTADNSTLDLFPVKKRGRPSTGTAKTGAERAAACRRRKQTAGALGIQNLNYWVDGATKYALLRLARHAGVSPSEILESLIKSADNALTAKMDIDSEEWSEYYK